MDAQSLSDRISSDEKKKKENIGSTLAQSNSTDEVCLESKINVCCNSCGSHETVARRHPNKRSTHSFAFQ